MSQTRAEAIEMVLSVLCDGSRSDRLLKISDDGGFFVTADRTYLNGSGGTYTTPCVTIPVSDCGTEEEDRQWAEMLLDELENKTADAGDMTT